MKVTLISHSPDPDGAVALAARLCYSSAGIQDLKGSLSGRQAGAFIDKIVSLGHHSVLEHASFTFGVEGISRACSHQLVRHRLASYSQKSQRYVVEKKPFAYVTPPGIRKKSLRAAYDLKMAELHGLYRDLVEAGVAPEDARYVLPNACATQLLVTMNARELRHFFELRLCERAQWEIRTLAGKMLALARRAAPRLFAGVGPGCVGGPCPEGDLSCGRIREVRRKYARYARRRG